MLRAWCVAFDPHDPERMIYGTFGRGFFEARWPRDHRPIGTRSYAHVPADDAHARVPEAAALVVRDFGPATFDYTYGSGWTLGESIHAAEGDGVAVVRIDATEGGGAGLVLGGANLAPAGQGQLALRLRKLDGNEAGTLLLVLRGPDDAQRTIDVDLSQLPPRQFQTLTFPLEDFDVADVQQIQIQGTNFSPDAGRLVVELDLIETRP